MKRTIKLNGKKANGVEAPRKLKIVNTLKRLGAASSPIEFPQLKKACRSVDPRVLRAHVRELRDMNVVTIRRVA